jgi:hypothetical protein
MSVVIGTIVLRCLHYAVSIGAEDVVMGDGPSTWIATLVLLGDGMRVECSGKLREDELPGLAAQLEDLLGGKRTSASLASADGTLYVSFERRSDNELAVALRLLRDPARGVIAVTETLAGRAAVEDFAARAKRFPY